MSDLPIKSKLQQAGEDSLVAVTSAVPVVGPLLAPFLVTELSRRHSEKRDAWLNDLERRLVQLESEGKINIEELLNNDKYSELAYFVIQQGQSTLNEEKHKLLSDILINYSQNLSMDDDKKHIFMKYVEQFTPSHVALMKLLAEPKKYYEQVGIPWPNSSIGSRTQITNAAFPSWSGEFINLLSEDLRNAGLIQSGSFAITISGPGLEQSIATSFGAEFLSFVRDTKGV